MPLRTPPPVSDPGSEASQAAIAQADDAKAADREPRGSSGRQQKKPQHGARPADLAEDDVKPIVVGSSRLDIVA